VSKVLIIEDDLGLVRMIRDWLAIEKYDVETVSDGPEALEKLKFYSFDLVVLDWQLPGMAGVDVLREFRAHGGTTPVLILTGKSSISEKEEGFDSGADDYLTKPFHMKELSARMRALLRRPSNFVGNVIKVGALELDPGNFKATKDGAELKLQPKEFALLEFFMKHPNQVFSSDSLLNRVWASESDATSEALTTTIKRLRKKIDKEGEPSFLKTVHGVGYKMEAV